MRRWAGFLACGLLATAAIAAAPARAADRIYWANYNDNTVSWANLDGSGGGVLPTSGAAIDGPMGLAIDSATGRLYGADYGAGGRATTIYWANLDGSGGGVLGTGGATIDGLHGVAIDPATQRIYWPNSFFSSSSISSVSLDGSGGANLATGNATLGGPRGIALDPGARRIYWANFQGNSISYANLDGSGGGDINTAGATALNGPEGVAIDPQAKRIYWGDGDTNEISFANLDGSGGNDLPIAGATPDHPHGVAVDPVARKIYWTNFNSNTVSWAHLNGGGGAQLPTPSADLNGPAQPILLDAPVASGLPKVTRAAAAGSPLRCSNGAWSPDLEASLLYREPETFAFKWSRNGKGIHGANTGSLHAHAVGDYRCRVTGTNPAGSATQTSGPTALFKLGKPKLDRSNGTAQLPVRVPDPGKLALAVKGLGKKGSARIMRLAGPTGRKLRAGTVKLLIKPNRKAQRQLRKTGKAKVRVRVKYTPRGGTPTVQARNLKLKLR
jgi:hypothetical protein